MRGLVLPLSPGKRRVLDVVVAAWTVAWVVIGFRVGVEVRGLSDLSETITRSGVAISESAEALGAIVDVPLVGDRVDDAAERVREAGESAQASGDSSEQSVRNLSVLLALAIAVIPALPVIGFYLPLRLAIVREARTVRRALARGEADHILELLAGRAAHTLPYRRLRQVTADPLDDLRARRYGRLAAAELERLGLGDEVPPEWLREREGAGSAGADGRGAPRRAPR